MVVLAFDSSSRGRDFGQSLPSTRAHPIDGEITWHIFLNDLMGQVNEVGIWERETLP